MSISQIEQTGGLDGRLNKFFSQTGNTQKITKSIYDGMVAAVAQCKIIHLKNMSDDLLSNLAKARSFGENF